MTDRWVHMAALLLVAVTAMAGCDGRRPEDANANAAGAAATQPRPQRHTYAVRRLDDHIEFYGIDRPRVVKERDGDVIEVLDKIGRHNRSRFMRAMTVRNKALAEMKPLVREAPTKVLLASLRGLHNGYTDYLVCRDGNLLILAELAKRRPLPSEQVEAFDAGQLIPYGVFLGVSGPPLSSIESMMDYAVGFDVHTPK
ncbi:MAG: hypothetical protein ACLFV7_04485 [Phycisphaerae bacterium]